MGLKIDAMKKSLFVPGSPYFLRFKNHSTIIFELV